MSEGSGKYRSSNELLTNLNDAWVNKLRIIRANIEFTYPEICSDKWLKITEISKKI